MEITVIEPSYSVPMTESEELAGNVYAANLVRLVEAYQAGIIPTNELILQAYDAHLEFEANA